MTHALWSLLPFRSGHFLLLGRIRVNAATKRLSGEDYFRFPSPSPIFFSPEFVLSRGLKQAISHTNISIRLAIINNLLSHSAASIWIMKFHFYTLFCHKKCLYFRHVQHFRVPLGPDQGIRLPRVQLPGPRDRMAAERAEPPGRRVRRGEQEEWQKCCQ